MRKLLITVIINILLINNVIAATANCFGGECELINSYHYDYAKTPCVQTLNYEEVETDYLYFIISKTGQRCDVIESKNKK
tara:strand:+ start:429 stop:668 length:240 start_codon:yes stop_codon:yes gene_type:complete